MSLIDKFRVIENHTVSEDESQTISKVENYFENYIMSDCKMIHTDYMTQLIWFKKMDISKLVNIINYQIKNFLSMRRKNIKSTIDRQDFEMTRLNTFLKDFLAKLQYINSILYYDDSIIKAGITNLSSLIISDSKISIFIKNQLISFDKNTKDDFEQFIKFCLNLSKYDNKKSIDNVLMKFGNIFKDDVDTPINVPLPQNIKRIQILANTLKYYEKVNSYFSYVDSELKVKLTFPIYSSLLQNLVEIIKNNSLAEIYYVIQTISKSFNTILQNNTFSKDILSNEITNMVTRVITKKEDIIMLINIITPLDTIIDKQHKEIINMKIISSLGTEEILDKVHQQIDTHIKMKQNSNVMAILSFMVNCKNKDVFINKYYEFLTKRLMDNIINKLPENIEAEMEFIKYLKIKFEPKLLYRLEKVVCDTTVSFNDMNDFNKLISKSFTNKMNIITTSYANWDINMNEGIVHSEMLEPFKNTCLGKHLLNYNKYYNMRYNNKRTLYWYPHFGEIKMTYNTTEYIMLPIQFMVVEMFEKENSMCVEIIKKAPFFANYTSKFVNDIISSLVLSNLFSISNMNLVLSTTTVVNPTSNLIDIFFTSSDYAEVWEQKRQSELAHNRHEIICSNVNHILKKKSLNKSDLFSEMKKCITIFVLEEIDFTKALDYLISNDYIILNKENKNMEYEKIFY